MLHVIDANNLAGKLGLLGEENFDEILLEMIKEYYQSKKIEVFLVFDSVELMGDKIRDGYITTIYTPRDSHYSSADDKIVELVEDSQEKQIRVITDDMEIIEAVEEIREKSDKQVQVFKASDFVQKLRQDVREDDVRKKLDKEQIDKLNEELLELWK